MITFSNAYNLRDAKNRATKSMKKTLRGVKRSLRHTFRKIFGEKKRVRSTSTRNRYENSTKFITDKMLSDSSDSMSNSSSSDTESTRESTNSKRDFFSFSVENTCTDEGDYQKLE